MGPEDKKYENHYFRRSATDIISSVESKVPLRTSLRTTSGPQQSDSKGQGKDKEHKESQMGEEMFMLLEPLRTSIH